MKEKWIKWVPNNEIGGRYSLDCIRDDSDGLIIEMSECTDENKKIKIVFEGYAWTYRNTNESFRLATVEKVANEYGQEFFSNWSFFKVENSSYFEWVMSECYGIYKDYNVRHFVFMGPEWFVDVVNIDEPKIEIINI